MIYNAELSFKVNEKTTNFNFFLSFLTFLGIHKALTGREKTLLFEMTTPTHQSKL